MIFDEEVVDQAVAEAAGERQELATKAFDQAQAGFELFGVTLAPYSPSRKVAAQGMGMLYPFVGEGGAEQLDKTGVYAGAIRDTMILCWLCTLIDADKIPKDTPPRDAAKIWTPSRAMNCPADAMEAALAWGVDHNLMDVNSEEFGQAYQVFMATVNGISASEFALRLAKEKQEAGEPKPEPEETIDPKA